jgi:hypothetical protein
MEERIEKEKKTERRKANKLGIGTNFLFTYLLNYDIPLF